MKQLVEFAKHSPEHYAYLK